MKISLNFLVVFYFTAWMISVMVFNDFQLINMSFLLLSFASLVLVLAFKRKKLLNVVEEE